MREVKCRNMKHFFNDTRFSSLFCILAITICGLCQITRCGDQIDSNDFNTSEYQTAIAAGDDTKAISLGDTIFTNLEMKYKTDTGFVAYKSKLRAAEFLAKQMEQQLRKATKTQMFATAEEILSSNSDAVKSDPLVVAPARQFLETSSTLFSRPVKIAELQNNEKLFLAQYYDLKLRHLTSSIARAGQALAIAEPDFKGTYDYTLVLPLLHASQERPINIDTLPRWMQKPSQLVLCSDSCLFHFALPFHAMSLNKISADLQNSLFSKLEFYRTAAKRCGIQHVHIAVDCLQRAVILAKKEETNAVVPIQFEIVQLWLDSRNYALAAGQAHEIFETAPKHEQAGQAIWLYYYALSRANDIDIILVGIDQAIDDERCRIYKPKLLYLKWWTLRRKRDRTASVTALEHQLLEQYGNSPMVAPILLSQATDFLARQDYNAAYELLEKLVQKFPSTTAGAQAKRMIEKLKVIKQTR